MRREFGQVVLHVVSSSGAWRGGQQSGRPRPLDERGVTDRGERGGIVGRRIRATVGGGENGVTRGA
ncbi:hypothetical protein WJ63_03120 [Burkholderia pyrrocinia]|nr:hypothetical protein WJ63_03120 [Burkholderia pyrrocinia]